MEGGSPPASLSALNPGSLDASKAALLIWRLAKVTFAEVTDIQANNSPIKAELICCILGEL